jgi:trk system potassium uptake protein TrkA
MNNAPDSQSTSSDPHDETPCYVLGGGSNGAALAGHLRTDDRSVCFVDDWNHTTEIPTITGDPSELRVLETIEMPPSAVVIVASRSDERNLLIAQLVRTTFDVARIYVVTNQPERTDPIADAGYEPLCVTTAVYETLSNTV